MCVLPLTAVLFLLKMHLLFENFWGSNPTSNRAEIKKPVISTVLSFSAFFQLISQCQFELFFLGHLSNTFMIYPHQTMHAGVNEQALLFTTNRHVFIFCWSTSGVHAVNPHSECTVYLRLFWHSLGSTTWYKNIVCPTSFVRHPWTEQFYPECACGRKKEQNNQLLCTKISARWYYLSWNWHSTSIKYTDGHRV